MNIFYIVQKHALKSSEFTLCRLQGHQTLLNLTRDFNPGFFSGKDVYDVIDVVGKFFHSPKHALQFA